MAALTVTDWGRIYAYVWQQERIGNVDYKILLEKDPVRGLTKIIQTLNDEHSALKINYNPGKDAVWDVAQPIALKGQTEKLKKYRSGELLATLDPNFAC